MSDEQILVKFSWDLRRMGRVEGLFVTTKAELDAAMGSEIDFGEALGKHSEVVGTLDPEDVKIISTDQDKIAWLVEICGTTVSGRNPLNYLAEVEIEDEG